MTSPYAPAQFWPRVARVWTDPSPGLSQAILWSWSLPGAASPSIPLRWSGRSQGVAFGALEVCPANQTSSKASDKGGRRF